MIGSYLMIVFFSDSQIVKKYPKFLILTYGFAFAKLMGILQLSHLENAKFKPFRKSYILLFMTTTVHTLAYKFFGVVLLVSIDKIIVTCFIINLLAWMHFVY